MANRFLTAPQAARELGMAAFSLHRMASRGEIRFQRLGRLWLFDRREVARVRRALATRGRQTNKVRGQLMISSGTEQRRSRGAANPQTPPPREAGRR